ncbi:MAG: 16S rRNA (uracil(1498)-N(3))-methyltransferase [Acidiferrobacterales bacterium]
MPAPRFYCSQTLAVGMIFDLPLRAAHHATRVLRLRIGDEITVFNGTGGEYAAALRSVMRDRVAVEIQARIEIERESPLDVTLVQAVSSGDRMDLTIRESVELGVSRISPVIGARSVVQLSGDRAAKRAQHWEDVVIAACEQCGRNRLPPVAGALPMVAWMRNAQRAPTRWMLSPRAANSVRSLTRPDGAVQLLVGPEGGFTAEEEQVAADAGFLGISLGPRTLRTETAAPAALAVFAAMWGDF